MWYSNRILARWDMRNNLPPGVSVNDIPGNRPIDRVWDKVEQQVDEMTVAEFMDRLSNGRAATVEQARLWLIEEMVDEVTDARTGHWDRDRDED